MRYLPYGQVRWSNGTSVTDFGFTSQRNEASFGLLDYNARYYSAVLGRFVSPDTIVPDPSSSGGFNRYRYTRNNPLKYTDPSGHCAEGEYNECDVQLTRELVQPSTRDFYYELGNWATERVVPVSVSDITPDLYIEGGSYRAVDFKAGGEKVYDFTTHEVGHFAFAGVEIGTNVYGGEVSVYRGMGYKGSFIDKSLEEAYSDRFFTSSVSGGPSPFISLDGGASVSGYGSLFDGPRSDAVTTVTIGGSLGAAFAPPINGAVSGTHYMYEGGIQFDDDLDMIKHIIMTEPLMNSPTLIGLVLLN